jgi:hypothetical protein
LSSRCALEQALGRGSSWTSTARVLLAAMIACSPSQGFRPAGTLDYGRDDELGLAVSRIGARPYVNETTQYAGQAWWSTRLDERWDLTALGAFDEGSAAGGAALRYDIATGRWAALAAEAEVGLFWVALSVPMTFRVLPRRLVLYSAPRLGTWGPELTPFIPLGVSAQILETLSLRAEGQVSWADFQYYNRRVHWGLAVAHQW